MHKLHGNLLSRAGDALNRRLVLAALRLVSRRRDLGDLTAIVDRGAHTVDDVELRSQYLLAVGNVWPVLAGLAIGAFGAASAVLHYAGAGRDTLGIRVFSGTEVALLLGAADALWRLVLVNRVRNRHREQTRLSERDRLLMRASLFPLPTLAIQVLAGIAVTILVP